MTAEIAVMNKQAVALAAESAVTYPDEKGQKIFSSANKIFALSKHQPIGVMVYGNAEFMEVPWETIIKTYRLKLGRKAFGQVQQYAEDFLRFLSRNSSLFPQPALDNHFRSKLYACFQSIRAAILEGIAKEREKQKKISLTAARKLADDEILRHLDIYRKAPLGRSIPASHRSQLRKRYGKDMSRIQKAVFEKLPMSVSSQRLLRTLGVDLFCKLPKEVTYTGMSGIVFAGFGRRQIFPVVTAYTLDGKVLNQILYRQDGVTSTGLQSGAAIVPFAQRDMVATFMEGASPDYQNAILTDLHKLLGNLSEVIISIVPGLSGKKKAEIVRRLAKAYPALLKEYRQGLDRYRRREYVEPVIRVVEMLPKDELAAMAESLVNLTSFKKRMSMEAETVGGPIDVAVISKGDGLILVKRKHYFKQELNPHFFRNYFEGDDR